MIKQRHIGIMRSMDKPGTVLACVAGVDGEGLGGARKVKGEERGDLPDFGPFAPV